MHLHGDRPSRPATHPPPVAVMTSPLQWLSICAIKPERHTLLAECIPCRDPFRLFCLETRAAEIRLACLPALRFTLFDRFVRQHQIAPVSDLRSNFQSGVKSISRPRYRVFSKDVLFFEDRSVHTFGSDLFLQRTRCAQYSGYLFFSIFCIASFCLCALLFVSRSEPLVSFIVFSCRPPVLFSGYNCVLPHNINIF